MTRRVALIAPADAYVGPHLARVLAARGYDLVLGAAEEGLEAELRVLGAAVEVISGIGAHDPDLGPAMARAGVDRFGTFHSVFFSSGHIAGGRFLKTSLEDLRGAFGGNVEAPYLFVQAVLPTMLAQGDGQVLVATSAAASRAVVSASLYAGTRAAATLMLQSAALEIADSGVQMNVVGTNFMDFPAFLAGNRAESPEGRARVEAMVPMKRLGRLDEFANFCAVLLDGSSRFQTAQFFTYAGGW